MSLFRSFRWQLILISIISGGISIFAFGWFSWAQVYTSKQQELDLRLQNFTGKHAPRVFSLNAHQGFPNREAELTELESLIESGSYAIHFLDEKGDSIWSSRNWPAGLQVGFFKAHAKELPPRTLRSPVHENGSRPPPHFLGQRRNIPIPERAMDFENAFFAKVESHPDWRLFVLPVDAGVIIVATDKSQLQQEMKSITQSFLLALPLALFFIAAGAAFIGTRAIRPVKMLTLAAENIQVTNIDQRIEYSGGGEEFRRLIKVYNQMLNRLDNSFSQAKRFSADAAHELNTPLMILQGNLDNALQEAEVGSNEQQQYSLLQEEVKQLITIVRKLLLLSRVDSGNIQPDYKKFSLNEMILHLLEDADILWEGLSFNKQFESEVFVSADRDWVQQIINNLITNACKYNREKGWVEIQIEKTEKDAVLTIRNSGEMIPSDAENRLFDRFYRVQSSRSNTSRSLGLGLSLANEFARLHKGSLRLIQNDAEGIGFQLILPLKATSA